MPRSLVFILPKFTNCQQIVPLGFKRCLCVCVCVRARVCVCMWLNSCRWICEGCRRLQ